MNFLWHLKAEKAMFLCYLLEYSKEVIIDYFLLHQSFIILILHFVFLSPVNQSFFIWHRNCYQAILETVSIDEDLIYVLVNLKYLFQSSRADVFTM